MTNETMTADTVKRAHRRQTPIAAELGNQVCKSSRPATLGHLLPRKTAGRGTGRHWAGPAWQDLFDGRR
jgi:hypothetical protein